MAVAPACSGVIVGSCLNMVQIELNGIKVAYEYGDGHTKVLRGPSEDLSGQSGSAGVIGNVVGRRAEEEENNTAAGWRTGVLLHQSGPVR